MTALARRHSRGLFVSVRYQAAWHANLRLDADGQPDPGRARSALHFVVLLTETAPLTLADTAPARPDTGVAHCRGRVAVVMPGDLLDGSVVFGLRGVTEKVMNGGENPALQRRRLRRTLREKRLAADLTQEQVAEKLYWSKSKVLRIENGQSSLSITDLQAMLRLYDVQSLEEVDALVTLARYARRPSSIDLYKDVLSTEFRTYLDHEAAAVSVLQYETAFIPGMLQTVEYAQATIRVLAPDAADEVVTRVVDARMQRQQLLELQQYPELLLVLDESILWRRIGGRTGSPNLFADQLRRLQDLDRRERISIRVLPFGAGEHPGMSTGSFTILGFESPQDDEVLYQELPAGGDVIERSPADLPRYHEVFERLLDVSLSSAESAALIADRISALEAAGPEPHARPPPDE